MTSPRTRLLAVGAVSAAFAASCIASLSTEPDSGGPLLPTPAAAAGALTPFVGCADVRDWYVEQAMSRVTAWGLDEPIYSDVVRLSVRDALRTSKTEAVGSSDTGVLADCRTDRYELWGLQPPQLITIVGHGDHPPRRSMRSS